MEQASLAAGGVLWAFGQFVTSGSLAVGVVLFVALAIVQFVVVTKGAARLSEVAARFVLDAMPGKQTAIDADLAAAAITADEARARRQTVAREADFYGAMDGASKFLRGEAVAAVLILLVNAIGGLIVGLVQYHWPLAQTAELFARLTIGAGLVMQIPALVLAVAAALIVSRSNAETDLGRQVISQLDGASGGAGDHGGVAGRAGADVAAEAARAAARWRVLGAGAAPASPAASCRRGAG